MALKLNKPMPMSGGGFTDSFKFTKAKHYLRVFPYPHGGELNLALVNKIHFMEDKHVVPCTGKNCVACAECEATGNKRLRCVTRYVMLVCDTEGDTTKVQRLDAPSSVYKQIFNLMQEGEPEDWVGNNGTDFIVAYNKNAQPADMYSVTPRMKGSPKLKIDDADLPDLTEEIANENSRKIAGDDQGKGDKVKADDEKKVKIRFKDSKGKVRSGVFTGRKVGKKLVCEVDGALMQVSENQVIGGADDLPF